LSIDYTVHSLKNFNNHESTLQNLQKVKLYKGKGKGHPRTGHERPEVEKRYSSTLSLTSALDGVGGERHALAASPPGKRPGTHNIGGWVGLRASLDGCRKVKSYTIIKYFIK